LAHNSTNRTFTLGSVLPVLIYRPQKGVVDLGDWLYQDGLPAYPSSY